MIIVLLANGFEEIEALTPVDMLRRAGLNVKTVGISGRAPTGAHGIAVVCDAVPEEIDLSKVTMAVFPGGMPGATNLDKSKFTDKVIAADLKNNGHLAAICAAPLILGRRGLLEGRKATCYPGFEKELSGATVTDCGCVTDGCITTARAMGSALDFAEELISVYKSKEAAAEISAAIYRDNSPISASTKTEDDNIARIEELISPKKETEEPAFVAPDYSDYSLPSLDLLSPDEPAEADSLEAEIQKTAESIINILADFGVSVSIENVERGPRLTRYEIIPQKGVKVSSILNLVDDIAICLGVSNIRAEAPIPGRSAIGLEIPNHKSTPVRLRTLLENEEFKSSKSPTVTALGRDISGKPIFEDIAKMPHLLIGGATGMGKSVCINAMITFMLYKASPDELKLLLIDPKQVEFTSYKNIPHLLMPIIFNPREAVAALKWVINEMERRYELLFNLKVRNIQTYNETVEKENRLPRIVVIIEEFADLMIQVQNPIEMLVTRIAQKARAAGIYLIIATQRPSTNVITGLIKANIPSRIAFRVSSHIDSKTLLDCGGAEKLLGKGDALYAPSGSPKPYRMQCPFISDNEVAAVTEYIRNTAGEAVYDAKILSYVEEEAKKLQWGYRKYLNEEEPQETDYTNDRQFLDAVDIAIITRKISTSLIQRKLAIGYGKAAKFIDIMEDMGIVGEACGSRPREVLITAEEWQAKLKRALLE